MFALFPSSRNAATCSTTIDLVDAHPHSLTSQWRRCKSASDWAKLNRAIVSALPSISTEKRTSQIVRFCRKETSAAHSGLLRTACAPMSALLASSGHNSDVRGVRVVPISLKFNDRTPRPAAPSPSRARRAWCGRVQRAGRAFAAPEILALSRISLRSPSSARWGCPDSGY